MSNHRRRNRPRRPAPRHFSLAIPALRAASVLGAVLLGTVLLGAVLLGTVLLGTVLLGGVPGTAFAKEQRVELGRVAWMRDFEAALGEGRRTGKPVLVLFTEIPGCATVRGYGTEVLSDPLIVDIAKEHFVAVVVHNNRGGADGRVLRSFGEPAWNNPVVRVINSDRKALAPRLDGDYTVAGLARTLLEALTAAARPIPDALRAKARP